MNRARRFLLGAIVVAAAVAGLYLFAQLLRTLQPHTRILVGALIGVTIVGAFAVWASDRLITSVEEIRSMCDDLDERRDVDREMRSEIREMAGILRGWWQTLAEEQNQEPTTEPIARQGTDTQPEAQAVGTAPDPWVAQEMARIMAKLSEPAKGER